MVIENNLARYVRVFDIMNVTSGGFIILKLILRWHNYIIK